MKIYRSGVEVAEVSIDKTTVLTMELMGKNEVSANWISAAPLAITLGDYILLGIEKYYLNTAPNFTKESNFQYKYQAIFESEVYKLFNKIFMDEGAADFTYYGAAEDYLLLLLENMNEIDPGWTFSLEGGETNKSISFNGESCRQALTRICEEFKLEFRLVQREIIVKADVGFNSTYLFEYGRGKGLYQLTRQSIVDKGVITRLYAFGGNKNLAYDYRDGAKRLVFETGSPAKRYLEANTELYGIKEGTITFEDIYPKRTGEVTGIDEENPLKIIDSSLDFNLLVYLLEGVEAKIVFKTGALAGYEFPITAFDNATKEITFGKFTDANDYVLPNELNFPEAGDLYTLVNIKMPQSYIDAAEAELFEQAEIYLDKSKAPRVTYGLSIDEKFMRTNGVEIGLGMKVSVKDTPLGLEDSIRIFSIAYPLVNPKEITARIADNIPYTITERIIKDNAQTKTELVQIIKKREEDLRQANKQLRDLIGKIYDPDGYFDPVNIKPGSIETLSLTVGANSQNFGLNGVMIEANYQADANRLKISGGNLIHFEIEIAGLGYVWAMDPAEFNALDPAKFYYVYARCNKAALTGTWVISETPIKTEQEAGFYHFWLGILYAPEVVSAGPPAVYGPRLFFFTKGITSIIGDTIRTGTIQSLDGLSFFNLNEGKFKIGDSETWVDWGVTSAGQLTINGAVVTKMIFAEDAEIINLKVSSLKTALNGKRVEILESENSIKLYDTDGNLVLQIDDDIDSGQAGTPLAGVRVNNPDNGDTSYTSGNGHFSNGSGMQFYSAVTGIQTNASIVGLLRRRNASGTGISAAVAGIDQTSSGESDSFGGFFNSLFAGGLHIGVKQITGGYTATDKDTYLGCYNTSTITVDLPPNPKKGHTLFIKRINDAGVLVDGNGKQIIANGGPQSTRGISPRGLTLMVVFDGSYWHSNGL